MEPVRSRSTTYRSATLVRSGTLVLAAIAASACDPRKLVAGNDGGGGGAGAGTVVVDDCKQAPTSFSHVEGRSVDYVVSCELVGDAALTIGPGTVIAFKGDGGITARKGLRAVGTKASPIVMRAFDPATSWKGIRFFSTDASNTLTWVKVSGAGAQWAMLKASVTVGAGSYADGKASIVDSTIEGSTSTGLLVGEGGDLVALERTVIRDGKSVPVEINPHNVGKLAGGGNKFAGNAKDAVVVIEVNPGKMRPVDQTWARLDVPYLIRQAPAVAGVQTIAPGVTIHFEKDATLIVATARDGGRLRAVGTAAAPIVFEGETKGAPWAALELFGTGHELAFCRISGGGGRTQPSGRRANVILNPSGTGGSSLSLSDCRIEGSGGWGIELGDRNISKVTVGANVTFTNNASGDISK